MSVNLAKGQKINLCKGDGSYIASVMVGLGWDPVKKQGIFGRVEDIDCDASVILCGEDGRAISEHTKEAVVYFGHLTGGDGAIRHQGDNLTGDGDGDDEQIFVDLNGLPSNIHKLVFVVNIYQAVARKQHFGMIRNAFIRIVNNDTGKEFCKFNLSDKYDGMTALVAGEIYKKNGEWKFNAIGRGTTDGSINDLLARFV